MLECGFSVTMEEDGPTAIQRIYRVAVIGAGTMGCGIAQIAAQSGCVVSLTDENTEILLRAVGIIEKSLARVAAKKHSNDPKVAESFIAKTLESITTHSNLEETVEEADLVIEAIIEDLETKKTLFAAVDGIAPSRTIFATNTSSLPVSEIASVTTEKRQFLGVHFFNPVPVMELVEVVQCSRTSSQTRSIVEQWLRALGKTAISCKDTPGFVVNRLLIPMVMDSIRMLEQGVASAESIDLALKLGAAHPMGPLRLADYIGLDVIKNILDGWHQRHPNEQRFEPSALLNNMVNDGKLGKKSGRGFYSYQEHL